jgi:hypothetical protein
VGFCVELVTVILFAVLVAVLVLVVFWEWRGRWRWRRRRSCFRSPLGYRPTSVLVIGVFIFTVWFRVISRATVWTGTVVTVRVVTVPAPTGTIPLWRKRRGRGPWRRAIAVSIVIGRWRPWWPRRCKHGGTPIADDNGTAYG